MKVENLINLVKFVKFRTFAKLEKFNKIKKLVEFKKLGKQEKFVNSKKSTYVLLLTISHLVSWTIFSNNIKKKSPKNSSNVQFLT